MENILSDIEETNVAYLSADFLSKREERVNQLAQFDETIINRINFITQVICKVFSKEYKGWYFPNACIGEFGDFGQSIYGNKINICYDNNDFEELYILIEGKKINLYEFIPIKWLTEDFEEELLKGKEAFKIRKEQKLSKLLEELKGKLSKKQVKQIKKQLERVCCEK